MSNRGLVRGFAFGTTVALVVVGAVLAQMLGFAPSVAASSADPLRGDLNCDGVADLRDIREFVSAIADPSGWAERHGRSHQELKHRGDLNGDGDLSGLDVRGLSAIIASHPLPVVGGRLAGSRRVSAPSPSGAQRARLDPSANGGPQSGSSSGAVDIDLDPVSPRWMVPNSEDGVEASAIESGKRIVVNIDDDDNDLVADHLQSGAVSGENDLSPLIVEPRPAPGIDLLDENAILRWRLEYPASVLIWTSAERGGSSAVIESETEHEIRTWILGDMNGDGAFNNFDIDPFVLALVDPTDFENEIWDPAITSVPNPPDWATVGDINGDGTFNNLDIDRFVDYVAAASGDPDAWRYLSVTLWVEGLAEQVAEVEIAASCDCDMNAGNGFESSDQVAAILGVRETGAPGAWGALLPIGSYSSVNPWDGNLITVIPLAHFPGVGPDLTFNLYHNSAAGSGPVEFNPTLGLYLPRGWTTSYSGYLILDIENDRITHVEDDGRRMVFVLQDDEWVPSPGVFDRLEYKKLWPETAPRPGPDYWVLTRKDHSRRVFDDLGRLVYVASSDLQAKAEGAPLGEDRPLSIWLNRGEDVLPFRSSTVEYIRDSWSCAKLVFDNAQGERPFRIREMCREKLEWEFSFPGTQLASVRHQFRNPYAEPPDDEPEVVYWTIPFDYDGDSGRITGITDKEGRTVTYAYDTNGRLATATDPPQSYDYPSSTPPGREQAFTYQRFAGSAGELKHRTIVTDRSLNEWTMEFSHFGGVILASNPLGNTVRTEFNAQRLPIKSWNALNHLWEREFDDRGNVGWVKDPLGHKTGFTWDANDNLLSVTPAADNAGALNTAKQILMTYQEPLRDRGAISSIIEPATTAHGTTTTTFGYWTQEDVEENVPGAAAGELRQTLFAGEAENNFNYHSAWGTLSEWYEGPIPISTGGAPTPHAVIQKYEPDDYGRNTVTRVHNGTGTVDYQMDGRPHSVSCQPCECQDSPSFQPPDFFQFADPISDHMPIRDARWEYYVPMPKCSLQWIDSSSSIDCGTPQVDKMGNVLRTGGGTSAAAWLIDDALMTEQSYRIAERELDEMYRLRKYRIRTTEPWWGPHAPDPLPPLPPVPGAVLPELVREWTLSLDDNGNLAAVLDPNGRTTSYEYDAANRLTKVKVSGVTVVTYTLYATGAVRYADYANGVRTEWKYDAANRLDEIIHSRSGNLLLRMDFEMSPDGLVTWIDVESPTVDYRIHYTYDERNRLIGELTTDAPTALSFDLEYEYDGAGNRLMKRDNLADPVRTTFYTYDVNAQGTFGSKSNRLMAIATYDDETCVERQWYSYTGGGHPALIVRQDAVLEAADRYHVHILQHDMKGRLWLARAFTCKADDTPGRVGSPTEVEHLACVEYRYDADGARYLERWRDPTDTDEADNRYRPAFTPLADYWHDYLGWQVWSDFEIPELTVDPELGPQAPIAMPTTYYTPGAGWCLRMRAVRRRGRFITATRSARRGC
ncbi:MAG: hypothetical protein IPM64_11810 [Phycisphaerales bacterium]|nr:hypothetical protein [Phycisphaerales bacterium]